MAKVLIGKAESLNSIMAACQVFVSHKAQTRQWFNDFKEFPEKCFDVFVALIQLFVHT